MDDSRRDLLRMAGTALLALTGGVRVEAHAMYGLIGQIRTQPGQRDALVAILLEGVAGMPGCLSYVVAKDPADPDAIWVTEVWDSASSHEASLALPSVRQAIARGKPLIAGFGTRIATEPVGGQGLRLAPASAAILNTSDVIFKKIEEKTGLKLDWNKTYIYNIEESFNLDKNLVEGCVQETLEGNELIPINGSLKIFIGYLNLMRCLSSQKEGDIYLYIQKNS